MYVNRRVTCFTFDCVCRLFESVARSCMQQKQAPPRETAENRE